MTTSEKLDRAEAPWNDEQVASLNAYQAADFVHPFTSPQGASLRATAAGWVEHDGGPVVQKWAHSFMADWSWRDLAPDIKARAYAATTELTEKQRRAIAKVIREAGDGMRTVAEQADKLAAVLEENPARFDAIASEMQMFHTLCNSMTAMLSLSLMRERFEEVERGD